MVAMDLENVRVEQLRLQQLGEGWIQAVSEGALDRLTQFCQPQVVSQLLTPKRFLTFDNASDLVAKYHDWYDQYTNFQLEQSRVARVGERLGIFYRLRLQNQGDWYRIEQQVYVTLKDGRVEKLHLLCSGFQLIAADDGAGMAAAPAAVEQDPARDDVLEFHADETAEGSTCTLLTPAIKSRLRGMQSGQVLEVLVDDPTARGDIEAWSRLSGNPLLKMVEDEGQMLRFFVQKK